MEHKGRHCGTKIHPFCTYSAPTVIDQRRLENLSNLARDCPHVVKVKSDLIRYFIKTGVLERYCLKNACFSNSNKAVAKKKNNNKKNSTIMSPPSSDI